MIEKHDLQHRQERPMRGQGEADQAIARMKGQGAEPAAVAPAAPDQATAADALTELRARILKARSVDPPSGDNQFAQGCFRRGRDAVLAIIDGEGSG